MEQTSIHNHFCPKCHKPMALQLATKGQYAGKKFYVCSEYPSCQTVIPFSDPIEQPSKIETQATPTVEHTQVQSNTRPSKQTKQTDTQKPNIIIGGFFVLLIFITFYVFASLFTLKPIQNIIANTTSTPSAPPRPREGTGEMILIPAGDFNFGCYEEGKINASCGGRSAETAPGMYLDAFQIDKYEVTNMLYAKCMTEGKCSDTSRIYASKHDSYYDNPTFDYYPVMVGYDAAQAYCAWAGKRLPSEAEWEKAARGINNNNNWTWGNEAPTCDKANITIGTLMGDRYCGSYVNGTFAIGSYPLGVSPYGVMDMIGNVAEWVESRRVHGGSWQSSSDDSAIDSSEDGDNTATATGIRCATSALP
jgi:formylglycine-generating enzyme required for sulfatase activity